MTHAWGSTDLGEDRDYYDPDPRRHDVPDLCACTHQQEDHTHSDDGCAWRGCTCRWYEPMDPDALDDYFEDGLYA